MSKLDQLEVFAAVAQRQSFRGAAKATGLSPSTMSQSIRDLEERLGVRLLNRTTRSVAVTEAGAELLRRVRPALAELRVALDQLPTTRGEPAGTLRINAPPPAIELVLSPFVGPFLKKFPRIRIDVAAESDLVDIVAEGFDAGVRWGENLAQDMIAVSLGPPQRFILVAAPSLLARSGPINSPQDLMNQPSLRARFPNGAPLPWVFERRGRVLRVATEAVLVSTNLHLLRRAAIDGLGFWSTFDGYVADDVASGGLVSVLDEWCPPFPGPFLYYPSRRQTPAALQAFVDFVRGQRQQRRKTRS